MSTRLRLAVDNPGPLRDLQRELDEVLDAYRLADGDRRAIEGRIARLLARIASLRAELAGQKVRRGGCA